MDKPKIRIYLIEDQAMIRAAFRSMLLAKPQFEVVGDCGDAREGVAAIEQARPDVLLLDITLPGLSGIDTIPMVRKAVPRCKVLMVTAHESERFVDQALTAGADGYLSKDSEPAELFLAIEAVYRGDPFISPKVAAGLMSRYRVPSDESAGITSRISTLTPREREVFQLLALGKANKEVARDLSMSLGTAKKHRENLQRKLDCHSAAELARLAIREGLLST
ncbi:MAG: DNA-binding NarL/FixJ family response regulator [Planctomycetota bacterium]